MDGGHKNGVDLWQDLKKKEPGQSLTLGFRCRHISINPVSVHTFLKTADDLRLDMFAEEDLSREAFIIQLKSPAKKPRPLQ